MAMAHSLLTDGPFHIPALHPGIYQFLLSHSRGLDQYYPQMEGIPITAQTIDLISLIEDVSSYYKGIHKSMDFHYPKGRRGNCIEMYFTKQELEIFHWGKMKLNG